MADAQTVLKALSDGTRFRIVEFLLEGEKCVCEIFPAMKRTQSTISIQLGKLEKAGILASRRDGKKIFYRINDYRVCDVFKALGYEKASKVNTGCCMKKQEVKMIVKDAYSRIADSGNGCSCGCSNTSNEELAKSIGYSSDEINAVPEANLGLGCGNPTAVKEIKEGMTVLDLGSGAGFDCFLAAKKVGKSGKVIGVDMTEKMIKKARENVKKYGFQNVEFRLGEIEELPVENNSVDVIISNCVINLSPDKERVFQESFRVLKKGGKLILSDMVLLKELSKMHEEDKKLLAGCVAGALLKNEYVRLIESAGFKVKIIGEDKDISTRQYSGLPVESLKLIAYKK